MRVLFVSVAFPPKADPEGLQTAKYFHYLQKHEDLKIDVVTSAIPTLYMPFDAGLKTYAEGVQQLISIRLNENKYVNAIRSRLGLNRMVFPDGKQSFHRQYKKALAQLKEKPDLIYSRADPPSSTIMAYKLRQELQVPWILHMSDPWADCPMHNRTGNEYKKHDEWERKCFSAATIISLTSIPTIEFYKKKYPEFVSKFEFFPNVFERSNVSGDADKRENGKFKIVYTGGLSERRSPRFLLEPLSILQQKNNEIADKIEVIFAGDVDGQNRAVFQQFNLPNVNWIGKVSFRDALALQRKANLLVVIDNPIEDAAMSMFFPSKLLDYMVAGKRILAITTSGSATDAVMNDLKGDICAHQDGEGIQQAIRNALEAYERGDNIYMSNNEAPDKYEAAANASRLYQKMLQIREK